MVDQAQDTLRPNNRLSDMQATMEQTQAFENRVLERHEWSDDRPVFRGTR
ncbi:hypothetical protein ACUOFC_66135, partial [Escherichia sp. TWPC-MK]